MEAASDATKTIWSIDQSHSEITFRVRHMMIAHVQGYFRTFEANISTYGKDFLTADIDLWIDASSISTGDAKRDEHLRSADFFDVQHHKQITFVASTIGAPDVAGNHEMWGELSIKGVTKNVMVWVQFGGISKDPYGNEKAGFTLTAKISRADWGLEWNTTLDTGGFLVSDEVTISCDVQLTNTTGKDHDANLELGEEGKIKAYAKNNDQLKS
jgi:polyisoprenoid-binding protein YceI